MVSTDEKHTGYLGDEHLRPIFSVKLLPTQNTERLELLQKTVQAHQTNTYNVSIPFQHSLSLDLTTSDSLCVFYCFIGNPRAGLRPTPAGAKDSEHRRPDVHPRDIHGHVFCSRSPLQSPHQPGLSVRPTVQTLTTQWEATTYEHTFVLCLNNISRYFSRVILFLVVFSFYFPHLFTNICTSASAYMENILVTL